MKSFIAALRSLVLPWGRTSGRRIILDGDNGQIAIYNASDIKTGQIDDSGYHLYRATAPGDLLAEATTSGGSNHLPGFIAWSSLSAGRYVFMGDEGIEFGDTTKPTFFSNPSLSWLSSADPIDLVLNGGRTTGTGTHAMLRLRSAVSGGTAKASIEGQNGTADFSVDGSLTAGNIRTGLATTPAPGGTGGTSTVAVTFAVPMKAVPNVVLTPRSTVDPATTTITAFADSVTANGFTIRCYRSTNSTSAIAYVAIS